MECCNTEDRVQPDTLEQTREKLKDVDTCIEAVQNKLDELAHEALQKAQEAQRFIEMAVDSESDLCHHQVAKQFEPLVDACLRTLFLTNSYHSFSALNESINEKMIAILEKINDSTVTASPIAKDILEKMRIKPKKKGWFNG